VTSINLCGPGYYKGSPFVLCFSILIPSPALSSRFWRSSSPLDPLLALGLHERHYLIHPWNVSHRQRGIREVHTNSIHVHRTIRVSPFSSYDPTLRCSDCRISFIITIPAEWRFYRSQSSIFHLTCVYCNEPPTCGTTDNRCPSVSPASYSSSYGMSRHRLIGRRNVLFRSNRCSYFSIVVMVVSNYGVFATSFTEETCQKYYFVSPVFKGRSYLAFYPLGLYWPSRSYTNNDFTGHHRSQVCSIECL